jgi:uncharacterized protein related to proFAR isomerase
MAFKEIPAISILDRTIVIARGDEYESLTIDSAVPNALDLIEIVTENYNTVYISDINGLMRGSPQTLLIKEISDFCEVWIDAGVNNSESVYDLFVAGASEVIISSKTLTDLLELAKAFELSENIIFELDYSNGTISPNIQIRDMSPKDLCEELIDLGINRIIFADLDRVSEKKSIEQNILRDLSQFDLEIYVGGGIKLNDAPLLEKLGASGAIIELVDILEHGKVEF